MRTRLEIAALHNAAIDDWETTLDFTRRTVDALLDCDEIAEVIQRNLGHGEPGDPDYQNFRNAPNLDRHLANAIVAHLTAVSTERGDTPDEPLPGGGRRWVMKRACSGCGKPIGDATAEEWFCGMNGLSLPDTTAEHGCEADQ